MFLGRSFAYLWASPNSAAGLLFVLPTLVSGGGVACVGGVLELQGGLTAFFLRRCTLLRGGASAMTLGHVVLGRDRRALRRTRHHERVHVRQCEIWGPLFIPAYLACSAVMWLRRRDPYRDNPFERQARELDRR